MDHHNGSTISYQLLYRHAGVAFAPVAEELNFGIVTGTAVNQYQGTFRPIPRISIILLVSAHPRSAIAGKIKPSDWLNNIVVIVNGTLFGNYRHGDTETPRIQRILLKGFKLTTVSPLSPQTADNDNINPRRNHGYNQMYF